SSGGIRHRFSQGEGAEGPPLQRRPPRRALNAEPVIVAGRGVVAADPGRVVPEDRAQLIHAAAHAQAGYLTGAAQGFVVSERGGADRHGAGSDVGAAALTVAANLAGTTDRLVVGQGAPPTSEA